VIVAELIAKLGLVPDQAQWDKGHELVESLHHAMEAYLGYEGLKKVGELVSSTVEAAQEAKNLGEQIGVSAEAVQELGYAAIASDVPVETLRGALFRLSKGLEDVKTKGTGPTADALQKLGVHMQDLKGESLDQNLEVLADAFAKAGPQVNKTALAIELFGRQAGPKMLLLLNKGKEGIVDLRNEAEKMGFVMGGDALQAADDFEAAQKRLHATLVGVRNTAVSAVLPALTEMAEGLGKWVSENREAIASTLQAVLEGLAAAFHVIGSVLKFVIGLFQDHEEIIFALIVALGLFKAASIEAAIASGIAWVLATLPLVLVVAAIALVVLAFRKLLEYITGKKVTFTDMWHALVQGGKDAVAWLQGLPQRAQKWIDDTTEAIKQKFRDMWADVVAGAKEAWQEIKDTPVIGKIISGAQSIGGAIKYVADQAPGAVASRTFEAQLNEANAAINQTNTFGDTNVKIDGSKLSPEELQGIVRDAVTESHKDVVRQAYTNLTGGKR